MALLDETGGKPLAGYGSGANSGAPLATAAEAAAMLDAQADALAKDANMMCRGPSATYEFAGEFCKAVVHESLALENRANILGREPSLSKAGTPLAVVSFGADVASGLNRASSAFGAALAKGSSYAAQNIKRTAILAQRFAPLARASVPVAVVGVLVEASELRSAARAATVAAGAALSAFAAGAACTFVAAETAGATAYACLVAVPAAAYWGGRGFGAAFDVAVPRGK